MLTFYIGEFNVKFSKHYSENDSLILKIKSKTFDSMMMTLTPDYR